MRVLGKRNQWAKQQVRVFGERDQWTKQQVRVLGKAKPMGKATSEGAHKRNFHSKIPVQIVHQKILISSLSYIQQAYIKQLPANKYLGFIKYFRKITNRLLLKINYIPEL